MKIILSRKVFDAEYGGIPSPILPDGTLLSLPIPYEQDNIKYSSLCYQGKSYYDIINEICPPKKGQEFVIQPDSRLTEWAKDIVIGNSR
jgi:hypothetical protein